MPKRHYTAMTRERAMEIAGNLDSVLQVQVNIEASAVRLVGHDAVDRETLIQSALADAEEHIRLGVDEIMEAQRYLAEHPDA